MPRSGNLSFGKRKKSAKQPDQGNTLVVR